jgi:prephenate dehydratase/chorismate mutase
MRLEDIRRKVDRIDRELLVLLHERMGLALRARRFKDEVLDAEREEAVLERAGRLHLNLVDQSFGQQLLRTIIEESKRLQGEAREMVAFQGEYGAYGELAARRLAPDAAHAPCLEYVDVFEGVEEGYFDMGVVPVEHSLEGSVTQVNDLLIRTSATVVGEVNVPVSHCLMAVEASDYRELRVVYSHPEALAQCSAFLERLKLEPRPFYDTAGAAKMLARENPRGAAAIASPLAAELYDLAVLKEGIDDGPPSSTRFLLLAQGPRPVEPGARMKCSIIFATAHQAGSLFEVLRLFADSKINLTRIASTPRREDPGNYNFFLDFEGYPEDERVARVLEEMKKRTIELKFLGSYPADGAEADGR